MHFGILYILETDAAVVSPSDQEARHGGMVPFSELENICANPECEVEAWSSIALVPLKDYISSLP